MKIEVLKLKLPDDKTKQRAMKQKAMTTVSGIEGVDSVAMDMKNQQLTVKGDMDPVIVARKLTKLCATEIISVETKEKEKAKKEEPKKPKEKKVPKKVEPKKPEEKKVGKKVAKKEEPKKPEEKKVAKKEEPKKPEEKKVAKPKILLAVQKIEVLELSPQFFEDLKRGNWLHY